MNYPIQAVVLMQVNLLAVLVLEVITVDGGSVRLETGLARFDIKVSHLFMDQKYFMECMAYTGGTIANFLHMMFS